MANKMPQKRTSQQANPVSESHHTVTKPATYASNYCSEIGCVTIKFKAVNPKDLSHTTHTQQQYVVPAMARASFEPQFA
jgi:sorbitol-specific phosphotransferase system component IIA